MTGERRGVLVVGEVSEGQLSPTSRETLAAGRPVAEALGEPLSIALLGEELAQPAGDAIACGADQVYILDHPLLRESQAELWVAALEVSCRKLRPTVILLARTLLGRDVAPRLAFRLGVGLLQDCVEVHVAPQSRRLVGLRPVYGGNVMARAICTMDPQIACIRPRAYEPPKPDPSRRGRVSPVPVELDASLVRVHLLERVKEEPQAVPLEQARVVVAGGRGVGGTEGFRQLESLARLLFEGAVGATRPPVDSGWAPMSCQIGLTGKTVTPDLYIAVGISGASQHMAGCSGARVIVAINRDTEAPIFNEADYGVAGDWKKVLPSFIQALGEMGIA